MGVLALWFTLLRSGRLLTRAIEAGRKVRRCGTHWGREVGACLAVGLLIFGDPSIAAPEATSFQAAPSTGVPLTPSTIFTLRYVDVAPCAPKRRPASGMHRHVHRPVRMTPVRYYTPVHRKTLPELLRKAHPVRCEVERRSPFMAPAVADGAPMSALPLSFPVAPTGAISSLPGPEFQMVRTEGTGPEPFANLPPITGAGEPPLTRSTASIPVSAAPEPAAWVLLMVGLGSIGALLRRRRSVRAEEA